MQPNPISEAHFLAPKPDRRGLYHSVECYALGREKEGHETKSSPPLAEPGAFNIGISHWSADHGNTFLEYGPAPADCHIVTLALEATRLPLSKATKPLFEGSIRPGMVVISVPGGQVKIGAMPPFDFLQFRVENTFPIANESVSDREMLSRIETAPFRDSLIEALGRSLLDEDLGNSQPRNANAVVKAIVLRAINQPAKRRGRELPKWRKSRLDEFLDANIDRRISLDDMAATADLSKMHFAAQFRALTGFRPHEYLPFKRIERAKAMMSVTDIPLLEVALSVGFKAQAHFSTVFKRFTGISPAGWRQEVRIAA